MGSVLSASCCILKQIGGISGASITTRAHVVNCHVQVASLHDHWNLMSMHITWLQETDN